jgi:hypothetical protein
MTIYTLNNGLFGMTTEDYEANSKDEIVEEMRPVLESWAAESEETVEHLEDLLRDSLVEVRYIIENASGQYWTGKCWGCREAAKEYLETTSAIGDEILEHNCVDAREMEPYDNSDSCRMEIGWTNPDDDYEIVATLIRA